MTSKHRNEFELPQICTQTQSLDIQRRAKKSKD